MFSLLTTLDIDMHYGVRRLQHKTNVRGQLQQTKTIPNMILS